MFKALCDSYPTDRDFPERTKHLLVRGEFLDGILYNRLQHSFADERDEQGAYIPIRKRRPSVRYNLAQIIVNDSVSMLFGDDHFPAVDCEDKEYAATINDLIKDLKLSSAFTNLATEGSLGSAALYFRVLAARAYFTPMRTAYLTPTFDPLKPNVVVKMREQYKTTGRELRERGYTEIPKTEDNSRYWFKREWDTLSEVWFEPWKVAEPETFVPRPDLSRSTTHKLGFCPFLWVRNLPSQMELDGACTFEQITDTQIQIEYQLSQSGRGLSYSSAPTLVIKDDSTSTTPIVAGDAIQIPTAGSAELLEIDGGASNAVIEYCRFLRELALESAGGNRVDASKLSTAVSGRAIELMNQALIWLASKLRVTYGEGALLDALHMLCAASQTIALEKSDGKKLGKLKENVTLTLKWPDWCAPTVDDQMSQATAVKTLRDANVISIETAVQIVAPVYDIEDVETEVKKVTAERDANAEREAAVKMASPAIGKPAGKAKPAQRAKAK